MRDEMPVGRRETFQILAMNAGESRDKWMALARRAAPGANRDSSVKCARIANREVLSVKRIAREYGVPV